jgi:hypothetical protein
MCITLQVSEYTDKVDILTWRNKTQRIHAQVGAGAGPRGPAYELLYRLNEDAVDVMLACMNRQLCIVFV